MLIVTTSFSEHPQIPSDAPAIFISCKENSHLPPLQLTHLHSVKDLLTNAYRYFYEPLELLKYQLTVGTCVIDTEQ